MRTFLQPTYFPIHVAVIMVMSIITPQNFQENLKIDEYFWNDKNRIKTKRCP